MTKDFGFKELYEVSLKATYPIEVGGRTIEAGEIIALFDKIQIANFQEIKNLATANGGFDSRGHVFWDSTKEIRISLTQGVFSKTQLALMSNASLIEHTGNESFVLSKRFLGETNEQGELALANIPTGPIFVYDADTGAKITNWDCSNNVIKTSKAYQNIIVDYSFVYSGDFTEMRIGTTLTDGYLSLTGKMRVKDDTTGKVVTGIIKIPKLRLMSDLSMRVGSDAVPQVGRLDAMAVPEGGRGQTKIMEIIFLSDDIDADM